MCIDDDRAVLVLLTDVLLACGYEVIAVSSFSSALKRLANGAVDAVVLDYNLPGIPGEAAALAVRQLSPQVRLLVFSGNVSDNGLRNSGIADEWVEKPDLPSLLSCLERWRGAQTDPTRTN